MRTMTCRKVTVARPTETAALNTALATVASFQGAVQHADEKLRTAVTVEGMLTAFMTAEVSFLSKQATSEVVRILLFLLLGAFVVSCVVSGVHIFQALRPRTVGPVGYNQFAFPNVASDAHSLQTQSSARQQCAEARRLAKVLAQLAMIKHHHVRRALVWMIGAFASSLATLLLFVLPG